MSEQTTTEEATEQHVEQVGVDNAEQTDETSVDTTEAPPEQEPETFGREYVQELRDEAAGYRVKAKDRDDLAVRLHTALVAATGRLADPTDLEYVEDHLSDDGALKAAIDDLVSRKPHLTSRKPRGDVGQGPSASSAGVDLAGILRSRA